MAPALREVLTNDVRKLFRGPFPFSGLEVRPRRQLPRSRHTEEKQNDVRAIYHPDREQALVRSFLGKTPGTFIDVGANHPTFNSQSHHLELLGWKGILVEPVPQFAEHLRAERKAMVFQVACGSPNQHGTKVKIHIAGIHSSLLPELMTPEVPVENVIEVPIRTLDSIIEESGFEKVDFISLDVEGVELEVLAGFSIERWAPRLILIEDLVLDWSKHRYLCARGYKLVRRTGINSWYVSRECSFPMGLYGRLQIFRKYVLGLPIRRMRFAIRRRRQASGA